MKISRIIGLILIITIFPFFYGCSSTKEENYPKSNDDIIELSEDVIKEHKIITKSIEEQPVITSINKNGEIKKNEDMFYTISAITRGKIISAPVKLGDYVRAGDIVAYIQNPEIAKINALTISALHENRIAIQQAKTKYNLTKENYEREKRLYEEGISPQKDLLQAKSDFIIAKYDLKNSQEREIHIKEEAYAVMSFYGVKPNFDTESLATTIPITAMKPGIITKKNVTLGAIVTPEQILYEVTDMRNLWLDIVLYSEDIAFIEKGQKIEFIPDSLKNKIFTGKIDYIQPLSNTDTQTFTARAFLDNKDGLLQPGMFGEVKIINNRAEYKPFVPESAIQKYGQEIFVFIDLGGGKYKKQLIEIGEKADGGYFINKGIKKGDKIVEEGSFTLKSEMLKSEFEEED